MTFFNYLPQLLTFTIGLVVGLELSYKLYADTFVKRKIEPLPLILALIGGGLIIIYSPLGLFFIGFVVGMRPGYGVYESIIGILFALLLWVIF